MQPGAAIAGAIRARSSQGAPALVAYLTAGFPTRPAFETTLVQAASVADVVEVGVPFSDPMADGLTIQRSSRAALAQGTTLEWALGSIRACRPRLPAPVVLMSYLNPLLRYGPARLAADAARAGVGGFVIPDLPYEESAEMRSLLEDAGLALVQMVTPLTAPARLARLAAASRGFVYAVTRTGTTGEAVKADGGLVEYLRRVRESSEWPVCAGFGIGSAAQVAALSGHADGCIVGSALVEALGQGRDAEEFLRSLRG